MANRKEIRVPDIGDFEKVPVVEVLVSEGEAIDKEQGLITLESDKATIEVPSPEAGTLVELRVSQGENLSEGDVIGVVEVAADDNAESNGSSGDGESGADEDRGRESAARGPENSGSEADSSAGAETGNRKTETESPDGDYDF